MRKDGPPDDRSTESTLLYRAMPPILKVAIIGGGGAMLHWALDMGPAFAALYLGALAAILATAIWHVIRSPAPAAIDRLPSPLQRRVRQTRPLRNCRAIRHPGPTHQ